VTSRLKDVVNDAIELTIQDRDAFLQRVCGDDVALLEEARSMLEAHAGLHDFLEPPDVSRGLWTRALEQAGDIPLVGAVLDDRYQLEERLGSGASGVVFEAADLLSGERVAVKILTGLRGTDLAWFRRELSALRLLELPGVVRLLDDGVHDGHPFFVMRKIKGSRFPGGATPMPWGDLAETAIALLETLARIHARGVVHGDLKPANVLVDAAGRPVVLDLGVSSGPCVPGRFEGVAGTPAYLAPEQLQGGTPTPRTDLYAVGVMLYEALVGSNPHPVHSIDALVTARLEGAGPVLADRGIDPRSCPCEMIDSLLAPRPEDRALSAAQAAAVLRGDLPPLEVLRTHPALQDDSVVDAVVQAAIRSQQVTLHGPPRSGRSLCLRRVATRLRRSGKTVAWFDPRYAVAPTADVVLADRTDSAPENPTGCVIRLVDDPGQATVRLEPLSEEALRGLFCGSDRIFHLREDSARELHRRTQGWPVRVPEELSAWVRADLARVEHGHVAVERGALDLLASGFRVCPVADGDLKGTDPVLGVLAASGQSLSEQALADAVQRPVAGSLAELVSEGKVDLTADGLYRSATDTAIFLRPEDHAAAARALPPGTPGRLKHLVAADATGDLTRETRDAGLALVREARVGRARTVIVEGLATVRGHHLGPSEEIQPFSALLVVAAAEGTERAFELALYEIGRAVHRTPALLRLDRLARVALLALRRDGNRALALADALGPFEEIELEQLRQGARAMAARSGRRDRSEEVLASVEDWAARHDAKETRCKLLEWKGWAAYVQNNFREAVELQEEALRLAPDPRSRLSTQLSVAETCIEAGLYKRARELAGKAKTAAAGFRHSSCEARAESILRFAAYRSGEATSVDHELLDALKSIGHSNLQAQLNLNEGAIAWRLQDRATALTLVGTADSLWREIGHLWGSLLTGAFLGALGDNVEVESLERSARECPLPGVSLQSLALLGLGYPDRVPRYRDDARRFGAQIAPEYRAIRREVASPHECMEWLEEKDTPSTLRDWPR